MQCGKLDGWLIAECGKVTNATENVTKSQLHRVRNALAMTMHFKPITQK